MLSFTYRRTQNKNGVLKVGGDVFLCELKRWIVALQVLVAIETRVGEAGGAQLLESLKTNIKQEEKVSH